MIGRMVRWSVVGLAAVVLSLGLVSRFRDQDVATRQLPTLRFGTIADASSVQAEELTAVFIGQDGTGYVGSDCTRDPEPDNIHISAGGVRTDVAVVGWEVHDVPGCGHWILPCNGFNWWLKAVSDGAGTAELYMKPHRNTPDDTMYVVIVRYADGTSAATMVPGSAVVYRGRTGCCPADPVPLPEPGDLEGTFLGQDGHGYVGTDCRADPTADNIHLRVTGISSSAAVVGYQVDDPEGYGRWVYPCNHFNWWLRAIADGSDSVDLFVKPHRNAPEGTPYIVTLRYADGTENSVEIAGTPVRVGRR